MIRFIALAAVFLSHFAFAQQPSLSQAEYEKLMGIHKLIEEDQYKQAQALLDESILSMSPGYAKALYLQALGHVAIEVENYALAAKSLSSAVALNVLPPEKQLGIRRTVGQLYCLQSRWALCVDTLADWMKDAPQKVRSGDHLLLSQGLAKLRRWR
ncbi:MAG: hypothetical protein ACPGPF_08230, partial [Pontibacterium sp.]